VSRASFYEEGGFEVIVGLEVHCQLATESKLFCSCPASFGAGPNEHTCPVCLGMPGVLPVLNRRAVEFAIRAALATESKIRPTSRWARKNYFYPDMPKAYQISQYEEPYCEHGRVRFDVDGQPRTVRLTRIHMEEDAGKSVHDLSPKWSLVDLNRASVPLLEIVSEPDIRSGAEASAYLRKLRSIVRYLGISDGNMNEGSMRCDANVSLRKRGEEKYGTRTETKNLNSFRSVERAIAYEIERQAEILLDGGRIVQETRLWDADRNETRPMRGKEDAHDYRYFPEPDLMPLVIDDAWIEKVRAQMPELPDARRARFVASYGLPEYDADVLTASKELADWFEAAVAAHPNAKALSNWIMSDVIRIANEAAVDGEADYTKIPLSPAHLAGLVALIDDGTISGKIAKAVLPKMIESGDDARTVVDREGLVQVTDEGAIVAVVDRVLAANPDKVAEYRSGKDKLFGFFVGQVMKESQGRANPASVNRLLKERLAG
jgi:aspartyl-tRNA(Asn)/glutamyl-tRNA(Gln) amidotransferase subunit B